MQVRPAASCNQPPLDEQRHNRRTGIEPVFEPYFKRTFNSLQNY